MGHPLKATPQPLDEINQVLGLDVENKDTEDMSPLPDLFSVHFQGGDVWDDDDSTPVCPNPLPPGTACAITRGLSGCWYRLETGDAIDKIKLSWSGGEYPDLVIDLGNDEISL